MAKTTVRDWDVTAANNTDVGGIGIQGTNLPSNFDNALREIMKQIADVDGGAAPVNDTWSFCDPADTTKIFRIDAGSITTATTCTYTAPNASGTLALIDLAQTWTAIQTFSGTITSGTTNSIARNVDNSNLAIFGGTAGLGANIELYGSTHATTPNQGFYDADTHSFRNANGIGTPTVTIGGNTVWHAGNDGSGSGLDADTLRTFAPATTATANTIMQRDSGGNTNIGQLTLTSLNYASTLTIGDGGVEDFRFNSDAFLSNGMTATKTAIGDAGTGLSFQKAGIIWLSRDGNAPMFVNRDTSDGIVAQFGRSKTAVGSISVTTTATAYNTSSSKSLKENWRDFDSGAIIDALDAWLFDWKNGKGSAYGVLAQDAVKVFPDAVTTDTEPDLWAVDYSKFVPLLLKEVKELRKRLAMLEASL